MSDVTVSIDLDATPAQVWALVEPVERHVDWMADAVSIRFETDQTRGVGTSFLCDTKVGPIRLTDRMEITEWVPADDAGTIGRMGVRHTGIVTGTGVFTIEPIDTCEPIATWRADRNTRRADRNTRRADPDPLHLVRTARLPVVPRWPAR